MPVPTIDPIKNQSWFLPDFCAKRLLLAVLTLGQMLAFLLYLAPLGKAAYIESLFSVSLFIHSISFTVALILCLAKQPLRRFNYLMAAIISYMIILLITLLYSWIVFYIRLSDVDFLGSNAGLAIDQTIHIKAMNVQIEIEGEGWVKPTKFYIFALRNLGVSSIVGLIVLRYIYLSYHWRLVSHNEAEFRVQALQARIHPHFFFNSMNTIASLTRIDPALAETAVENLSALFRATLANANNLVTLDEELTLCKQYLALESLRLGNRLQVNWTLDTLPKNALVPSLSIQPLLENAVHYGIQPLPEGGIVQITGLCDGKHIKIDIENPLPSIEQQTFQDKHKGNHIAIDNLKQRLHAHYGQAGRLELHDLGTSYQVSMCFPLLLNDTD